MPQPKVVRRTTSHVEKYTIWDNFDTHRQELEAAGATDDDIRLLKVAAQAVADEQEREAKATGENPALADASIPDLTAPHTCANGWVVNPPTLVATRWAAAAMMKMTGGVAPADPLALAYCMLGSLWVLKTWGDGGKLLVMRTVMHPDALAELLPGLSEESAAIDPDQLAMDYMHLMGLSKKKVQLQMAYTDMWISILGRLKGNSTTESSSAGSSPGVN